MNLTDTLHLVFAYRAHDLRDRFPEPLPTFRAALERLQSDRACMPEIGEIMAYLRGGSSIEIPTSFYIRQKKHFETRANAEQWVLKRAAEAGEKPVKGLRGMLITNPDEPIEKQIEEAADSTYSSVAKPDEKDTLCTAVDNWLRQAILALPETPIPSSPKRRRLIERFQEKNGLLLRSFGGHLFFRETRDDGRFIDYEILHSDLAVRICDEEAAVYEINGAYVIDHTPETLGFDIGTETGIG